MVEAHSLDEKEPDRQISPSKEPKEPVTDSTLSISPQLTKAVQADGPRELLYYLANFNNGKDFLVIWNLLKQDIFEGIQFKNFINYILETFRREKFFYIDINGKVYALLYDRTKHKGVLEQEEPKFLACEIDESEITSEDKDRAKTNQPGEEIDFYQVLLSLRIPLNMVLDPDNKIQESLGNAS